MSDSQPAAGMSFDLDGDACGPDCGHDHSHTPKSDSVKDNFSFTEETLDETRTLFKVTYSAAEIQKSFERELSKYIKGAKINGFRPGKAPKAVIERLYADSVIGDVTKDFVSNAISAIREKQARQSLGSPKIRDFSYSRGSDLTFAAEISFWPDFTLPDLATVKVPVGRKVVVDADVDGVLERMRSQHVMYKPAAFRTAAAMGDRLNATVLVWPIVNGALATNVKNEKGETPTPYDDTFVLSTDQPTVPVKELIGISIGETRTLFANSIGKILPWTSNQAIPKNATAKVEITLLSIEEPIVPELNDEFVKSVAPSTPFKVETLLELRLKVREFLEKSKTEEARNRAGGIALEILADSLEFSPPIEAVEDELRALVSEREKVSREVMNKEDFSLDPYREKWQAEAVARAKRLCVLIKLRDQLQVTVKNEEVDDQIEDTVLAAGGDYEKFRNSEHYGDLGLQVYSFLMKRNILEALSYKVDVVFEDITKDNAQPEVREVDEDVPVGVL